MTKLAARLLFNLLPLGSNSRVAALVLLASKLTPLVVYSKLVALLALAPSVVPIYDWSRGGP